MKYKYICLLIIGVFISCTPSYSDLKSAIERSDNELVLEYIEKGVDLNNNSEGEYPLFLTLERLDFEIMKILVNNGAEVDIKNENGETPIFLSYMYKKDPITKLFAENGGNVNFQVKVDGETKPTIIDLIEKGNEELAKSFLLANQDLTVTGYKNRSIMHMIVSDNSLDFMKFAIKANVPIDNKDIDEESPLTLALDKGYIDKARLLIDSGALIENDPAPWSALIKRWDDNPNEMIEIAEIYLEKNIPKDSKFDNPIRTCVYFVSVDAMRWFLEHGFSPNIKEEYGETAIDFVDRIGGHEDNVHYQRIRRKMYALLKEYGAGFYKGN